MIVFTFLRWCQACKESYYKRDECSRDVTPRESDVTLKPETEAADFSRQRSSSEESLLTLWMGLACRAGGGRTTQVERVSILRRAGLVYETVLCWFLRPAEADLYTTCRSVYSFSQGRSGWPALCLWHRMSRRSRSICSRSKTDQKHRLMRILSLNSEVCLLFWSRLDSGLKQTLRNRHWFWMRLRTRKRMLKSTPDTEADWSSEDSIRASLDKKLVETDSEIGDANSEACLFEADSEALIETDSKLKIDSALRKLTQRSKPI